MIFNGEIYNHNDLRKDLDLIKNINWSGHSDTETLLSSIEQWGLEQTLKRTVGMFAIALWDKRDGTLHLACDRMGEKPIYYGLVNNQFVFASELKAIKKFPNFNNPIDRNSVALFMRFNSIPSPHSIYKDIFKLEPGHILKFDTKKKEYRKYQYWSTNDVYEHGKKNEFAGSPADAVSQLEIILSNAVSSQMQSDVPLGAFLSGGVDSSTIVALMQAQSNSNVNTFSVGFDTKEFDEAKHAKLVANHLGTNHFDIYLTDQDALNVIPYIPKIYDEPFADSSQIPTFLVSKFAKQKVTVALSGDAGDELFGGYNRYLFTKNFFNRINNMPISLRKLIAIFIFTMPEQKWNSILNFILPNRYSDFGHKLHKVANAMSSKSTRDLHFKLVSQIQNPSDWLLNFNEYKTFLNDDIERFFGLDDTEKIMAYDLITYLPTDILTKVDRAAMAVSLETRIPFLDPNVIKFAASLPIEFKIRDGVTKWVVREVLYKYVPK